MDFEITPENVKVALDRGDKLTPLDVRDSWEYEVCRIAGSKHLPMGDVPSRAYQELDPDQHVVAFCHHGVDRCHELAEKAQSMSGGIDRWARVVDPKVPTY